MGYRIPDTTFGDGSDGHARFTLAGGATQEFTKGIWSYASLTIDEGVTVKQKHWAIDLVPIFRINCLTPIVINGSLSASAVAAHWSPESEMVKGEIRGNGAGNFSEGSARPPLVSHQDGVYPIAGGGAGTSVNMGFGSTLIPGYTADTVATGADGDSIFTGDRDNLIGPDRMFRYCAGCGGGQADMSGGDGGGILLVTAPAIIFGPNGKIEATGGDGPGGAGMDGAAGGGGGYIETVTKVAVELAKLDVSGGVAQPSQYSTGGNGMDGLIIRRIL